MTILNLKEIADFLDDSGRVALINADVLDAMSRIPENSINMVVTSPPYWTAVEYDENNELPRQTYDEYIKWLGDVWLECFRVLQPNGKIIINTPVMPVPKKIIDQTPRHLKNIASDIDAWIMNNSEFLRYGVFVWQKQTSKMMFGSYPHPPNILENNTIEFMNVYVKPGPSKKVSAITKSANKLAQFEWLDLTQQVWFMYSADVKRSLSHPAPFPNKLPARFMKMYTYGEAPDYLGDVVLDPFNGAGTTSCVAKMLRRRAIGIELSKQYHGMAKERLGHILLGQDFNWLVGRPGYMNADELEKYRIEKRQEPDLPKDDLDKVRVERQHKQTTYGRGAGKKPEAVQTDLFSKD